MKLRRFFCIVCLVLVFVFMMQIYFIGMLSRGRDNGTDLTLEKYVEPQKEVHEDFNTQSEGDEWDRVRRMKWQGQFHEKKDEDEGVKDYTKNLGTEGQKLGPHDENHPHSKYSSTHTKDEPEQQPDPYEYRPEPPEPERLPDPPAYERPTPEERTQVTTFKKSVGYELPEYEEGGMYKPPPCDQVLDEEEIEWEKRKIKLFEDYDPRYVFEGIYKKYDNELQKLAGILEPGEEVDVDRVAEATFGMMDQIQNFVGALTGVPDVDPIPLFTSMLQTLSDRFNDDEQPDYSIFISYGDRCCKNSLPKNVNSALKVAEFDEAYAMGAHNLSESFKTRNEHILKQGRGGGYWIWKSKIILDMLMKYPLSKNVVLFYGDAGMYWKKTAKPLMKRIRGGPRDTIIFSMAFEERQWSKRDAFILMDIDREEFYTWPVAHATQVSFRNTLFSRWFVSMWNYYCQDDRIVTDRPNTQGKPNLPGHSAHRHDQSVLGLMTKKFDIGFDEFGYSFPLADVLVITRNKS